MPAPLREPDGVATLAASEVERGAGREVGDRLDEELVRSATPPVRRAAVEVVPELRRVHTGSVPGADHGDNRRSLVVTIESATLVTHGRIAVIPLDSVGLVLPEPSWPDVAGSAGVLEPLRRFCNSTNRENGADAWRTPAQLAHWLAGEGYADVGPVDRPALGRLVDLREALWRSVDGGTLDEFVERAGVVTVRLRVTGPAARRSVPAARGTAGVIAHLALAVAGAASAGVLDRLKSCQHCRWVFHDTSRNRRGRWCSMAACGSRQKARAYRQRHAAEPRSS